METINKYEDIIIKTLEEYAKTWSNSDNTLQSQVVVDSKNKHYQFLRIGWRGDDYIHNCIFHIDIIKDKVWIQENRTDILLEEELVDLGIQKTDIVLGVLHPQLRPDSDYAVA